MVNKEEDIMLNDEEYISKKVLSKWIKKERSVVVVVEGKNVKNIDYKVDKNI
jgi:hypothetical protein